MSNTQEEFEMLLSGYLDAELDEAQLLRFEALLSESPSRREEVESMQRLYVGTNALFAPAHPADTVWDTFLDDVYNRIERRFAWAVVTFGAVALSLFAVFEFVSEPWGPALLKVLIAVPVAGLLLLFISVLRNRLHTLKTDRYEREVHR
jgi:hypothetical protein